jgi:Uma2 family endonuclease
MVLQEQLAVTPQQYLRKERQAETRSEYFNGEVFAMAGASREHNQISYDIVISLGTQLAEKPCNIYSSDMNVVQVKNTMKRKKCLKNGTF